MKNQLEQEVFRPGESFRFTYELNGFDNVTFLGIYLIYRERVEYHDGNETMVQNYARAVQQFILKDLLLGEAAEPFIVSPVFKIPNREMGIRNPFMQHYDARVTETSWHIRIIIDPLTRGQSYSDLKLRVEGEDNANEPDDTDQHELFDVFLVEDVPVLNIKQVLAIAALFPYLASNNANFRYLPALAVERVSRAEAEQMKADLEAAGAVAVMRPTCAGYGVPEPGLFDGEPRSDVATNEMKFLETPKVISKRTFIYAWLIRAIVVALAAWYLIEGLTSSQHESSDSTIEVAAISGLVLVAIFIGFAWPFNGINKITAQVTEKRLQAGDCFRFIYQKEFSSKTEVQWLEIWLVYRERVSYSKGKSTRTAQHDRLVQKFSYGARNYEKGETFREDVVFQIPNREMGIENLYMQLPDAKVTGTEWLVRVRFDAGGSYLGKSEYKLD